MVAFNFQPRFAASVRSGAKRQTIRPAARVRPGQMVQLYTGLRQRGRAVKLRPDQVCTLVWPVGLDVGPTCFGEMIVNGMRLQGWDRDRLAIDDGFATLADMHRFWLRRHGVGRFEGHLIRWAPPAIEQQVEAA